MGLQVRREKLWSPNQVLELLVEHPPVLLVRIEERTIGRAAFDGLNPEAPFAEAAKRFGYSATVSDYGGAPPFHGWMGPGDRWVEIRLVAPPPIATKLASNSSTSRIGFPVPEEASIQKLVEQYRIWIDEDEFAECFGDWIRRFRSGRQPESSDSELLFWYHGLAAYAGLRDGRGDPSDLAIAAGLAEQAMDHTKPEQTALAAQNRSLFGI
jgi:hypothetical protein